MSILIFVLVLFALVLVHELGHFLTAKKTGMRVDEFGIGFPPRLVSFKRGETEYSINALPIGGFVRIYGEEAYDASAGPSEESLERSEQGYPEGVQHRYDEHGDDLSQHETGMPDNGGAINDRNRSFVGKPKRAQVLVLLAGISANILFGWLLFTVALTSGILTSVSAEEATETAELYILSVIPESPAELAGIPAGAIVTALTAGGQTIAPRTPQAFRLFIEQSNGAPVTVTYIDKDTEVTAEIVPQTGVLDTSEDAVAIGVSLGLAEVQSLPLHKAIAEGFLMTIQSLRDIIIGIFSLLASAFFLEADLAGVAGPVGIVGLVGDASALGLSALLMFTAIISLNLAVINILPFPALDGGRLFFVLIEWIKGSPIKAKVAYYVNATGFVVLILLMVAITYNDIVKLV